MNWKVDVLMEMERSVLKDTAAPIHVNVLVIGAGPGGYVAAIRASQLGKTVVVVDENEPGGVCLHSGCIPSKALISAAKTFEQYSNSKHMLTGIVAESVSVDFSRVQLWKQGIIQKLKSGVEGLLKGNSITFIQGTADFMGKNEVHVKTESGNRTVSFDHCIIASGSRPIELPGFKFGGTILSSKEVLKLDHVPQSMVVLGGGYIGVELGQAYAKLGTKVTILEYAPHILPLFEAELSSLVARKMKKNGIDIVSGAKAETAQQTANGVSVRYSIGDQEQVIEGEYLFVAVGRKPNTDKLNLSLANVQLDDKGLVEVDRQGRTSNPAIFAIGDIVKGPALAHKASYEAKVAAEASAGLPSAIDYKAIPSVIFSDPEIAVIGLSEREALDNNYSIKVGKFSYGANGRALSLHGGDGFVRIIADEQTGLILGGQVVGLEASNLIAEIGLAIEMGSNLEDIASTIHAHPTLGEIVMEASENGLGMGVHSL